MICDSHIHFIPPKISEATLFYKGVWSDEDKLLSYLDSVDKAFLVYPSTDAATSLGARRVCDLYNSEISKIITKNKKIIGAGIVDFDSDIPAQIKQIREQRFSAVSIASSEGGKFLTEKIALLAQSAQENNLVIFVHPQTINPIGFERVKDPLLMPVLEYSFDVSMCLGILMTEGILSSGAKFIFSSLAGIVPFLKDRLDRVYTMLRARGMVKDLGDDPSNILKGVYVDTSGSPLSNINQAIDLFGQDKVLWGSDYPVCGDISSNIAMLDELGDDLKEKITSKNFLNLFS
ncbi:MAG: amidohydrolase family protein [Candidatus Omnitrophica bacterium]|nr:amidohydrolase family protein [Candidatus Omnitrophota bacterium]